MKVLKDKRGVVLILVLSVVALFTAMIVSFGADESLDIELAYNFRDSLQAQYIARAGVEAAITILSEDDTQSDSLDDQWASFAEYAVASASYLDDAQLSGTITDECSKFDLNSLAAVDLKDRGYRIAQFKRLFTLLKIDITDEELDDLAHAVIDWIDADSDTDFGAEEEYYQSLDPPYHCKNAPLDSAEEILLVRGMKPEYFSGTENYEGIRNYVTVGTKGKININTASETVLRSLSDRFTENAVNSVLDCRPFTEQTYDCIKGIDLADGSEESIWIKSVLDVKSARFSADMKGSLPSGALVNVRAVLERINNSVRIVYYRIY
ncbi:MAG: type II secretion system minor pseudopilin GspK [Syntrophaceae bacterium]|nr:type II secretion system minor pseudopilin GspK [Deltaproteobacteria bacterium]